jgi:LacI family transcriptional regulator
MHAVRRVTVAAVAKEAGVSISTVSLALNGKGSIPAETRQRVNEIAREMGYTHRNMPRHARKTGLSNIGMVIRSLPEDSQDNPFYPFVQAGIENACRQNNINLTYATIPVDRDSRILEIPRLLIEDQVDGLLAVGLFINDANAMIFDRLAVPVVLADAYATSDKYDAVVTDNFRGAYDATAYLMSKGHRHIAFAGSHAGAFPSIYERRMGYLKALEDHGIPDHYLLDCELSREQVYAQVREHFDHPTPVTALFCANDFECIGALQALRELSLSVPNDLSLMGFDDDLLAPHITPSLTTMQIDKMGMGRLAVSLLINRAERMEAAQVTSTIRPRVIERESVSVCRTGPI